MKFAKLASDDGTTVRHDYGDIWRRDVHPDWSMLTIGPSRDHIDLIIDLAEALQTPLCLLWVLVTPMTDAAPGRYQSPIFEHRDHVSDLLRRYKAFFEGDGRHHLWLANPEGAGQLVYDNHELIYAYGPLDSYESTLRQRGFHPGDPKIPFPHAHSYNSSDPSEHQLMQEIPWQHSPLVESHDNP